MSRPTTPSQTAGPYFGMALPWPDGPFATQPAAPGAIWISGRIIDGAGDPVPDALIETWQADPDGRFDHAVGGDRTGQAGKGDGSFRGFARCPTDADGHYAILTLKPGRVVAPDGRLQAPHLDVSVFARGLLKRVITRCYFADEATANDEDPVLAGIEPAARATLVAERVEAGYRFDIHLQGERETVFFEV